MAPTPFVPVPRPADGFPPAGFDYEGYLRAPPHITPGIASLAVTHTRNIATETFNDTSSTLTLDARLAADPSICPLGEPLRPFIGYSVDDLASMRMDFKLKTLDRDAVPKYIFNFLLRDAAEKEAVENAAAAVAAPVANSTSKLAYVPTLNSLELSSHAVPDSIFGAEVQFTEIVFETVRQGQIMPITWFKTERVQHILVSDAALPRKTHLSSAVTASGRQSLKIDVLDVEKLKSNWGDDCKSSCITAYTLVQSLRNMLECVRHLSKAPDANGSSLYLEFKSHVDAVESIKDLEENLAAIYDVEREQRNRIVFARTRADIPSFKSQCSMLIAIRRSSVSPSLKRSAPESFESAPSKKSSSGAHSSSSGSSAATPRAPCCLSCANEHRYSDHPQGSKSFSDGTLLFSTSKGNKLVTVKGGEAICVAFNLVRGCQTKHAQQAIHVCSLCGSTSHGALQRDSRCSRFRDGSFRI